MAHTDFQSVALPTELPGQQAQGIARSATEGQGGRKLTTALVVEMRERRAAGETVIALAAAYGVTNSMVAQICIGLSWRNCPGPITRRRMRDSLPDRMVRFSDRTGGPDACWPWLGGIDTAGYGKVSYAGKTLPAHRVALELRLGRPLRDDEVTRHGERCPRWCVNGHHLLPGSHADNVRDTVERGRCPRGAAVSSAKLTDEQVLVIRGMARPGNFSALGRKYGVSANTIERIARGHTWRHLLAPPEAT